jgi:hypothetical protein
MLDSNGNWKLVVANAPAINDHGNLLHIHLQEPTFTTAKESRAAEVQAKPGASVNGLIAPKDSSRNQIKQKTRFLHRPGVERPNHAAPASPVL